VIEDEYMPFGLHENRHFDGFHLVFEKIISLLTFVGLGTTGLWVLLMQGEQLWHSDYIIRYSALPPQQATAAKQRAQDIEL